MPNTKKSLSQRITDYLRAKQGFINGGEIERLTLGAGYKASNGSRRCRELAEAGTLERKEQDGSVWYRYKPQKKIVSAFEEVETPDGIVIREVEKEVYV